MNDTRTSIPITIKFGLGNISEEAREKIAQRMEAKLLARLENASSPILMSDAKAMAQEDFESAFLEVMGYSFVDALRGYTIEMGSQVRNALEGKESQ